ncbi:MAG: nucleoside-diphosphate kinase [Promethearchaeota archaeon]
MNNDRTLIIIKPDAVRRKIIGEIISRFEKAGYKIINLRLVLITRELAEEHYAEHKEKAFYDNLLTFITSGPSIALIVEGENIITSVRKLVGATNPAEADLGTIRRDFWDITSTNTSENIIHASDSEASAKREIALFFGERFT